jgi:hypothetical protein
MSTLLQRVVNPREFCTPGSGSQSGSGGVQRADDFEFVLLGQRYLGHSIKRFKEERAT